jgi:hypothetical protein
MAELGAIGPTAEEISKGLHLPEHHLDFAQLNARVTEELMVHMSYQAIATKYLWGLKVGGKAILFDLTLGTMFEIS